MWTGQAYLEALQCEPLYYYSLLLLLTTTLYYWTGLALKSDPLYLVAFTLKSEEL